MLRELIKARAEKLARAQAIWDTADKEAREFTEAEKAEFEQIMGVGELTGEIGALDVEIEDLADKRERLRTAAEKKFIPGAESAQKPSENSAGAKVMTMADYNKLSPEERLAFSKAGGKLTD